MIARALLQRETVVQEMATRPELWRGSPHHADVEDLQTALNTDGAAPPLVVDGIFGPLTEGAVREFQRRHGLLVDGVVHHQTWGMIGSLARGGIAGPTDALAGTQPVTAGESANVETILHPGGSGGGGGGGPVTFPAMTGAGPGAAFENDCFTALDTFYAGRAAERSAQIASPVAVNNLQDVGAAAQESTETFFASNLVLASRTPTGSYHPGRRRMPLADSSTRVVDEGTAWGWTQYFLNDPSYATHQPLIDHEVHPAAGRPDAAEVTRVALAYVRSSAARRHDITLTIQGWPAEAGTGTVFIQNRYVGMGQVQAQWDMFTTLIHEFLHLVTHPNYNATAEAISGTAQQILIEGMTDHMRDEVWQDLRPGLAGNTSLRRRVEGPHFQAVADESAFEQHSFYDQKADADRIAGEVGEANARAAYFMGHTDLLGLGAGSTSAAPLTGLATWRPTDEAEADVYFVPAAGETIAQIRARTNSTAITELDGTVRDDPAYAVPGSTRLHVAGIRWHHTIAQDTRAQVANQNGVSLAALEAANGWAPAPGDTALSPGTLVLIPAR